MTIPIYNNLLFNDNHCHYQDTTDSTVNSGAGSGAYQIIYQSQPNNNNLLLRWNGANVAQTGNGTYGSGNNLSANGFAGVTNNVPNPWVHSYSSSLVPELSGNEYYFQPTRLLATEVSGDMTTYFYALKWCHPRVLPYYRNTLQIDDDGSDSDFNDFVIYLLPESDAYFVSSDDYLSSANSSAPTTVVRDGVGSNPPTYNIDWGDGSGSQQGAPTMSEISGFGLRVNKPQTLKLRFSRSANLCIRTLFFKPDNTTGGDPNNIAAIFYTYDGKIEEFSDVVDQGTWGGIDESHTWSLYLQKGLGSTNESGCYATSGTQTCDQCNQFGVEQVNGSFKWTSVPSAARVRIRSTPPANIPAANYP